MKFEKIGDIYIPFNAIACVKEMGDLIEVTYNSNLNTHPQVIKINAEEYYLVKTGEIKKYKKDSKRRTDNVDGIRKTMKKIKELVLTNVVDNTKVRWCTLTYKENMTNTKKLYEDFRRFNQKFQRYIKRKGFDKAEYIMVAEPQERGSWHCHIIYIFNKRAPYISNDDFANIWKHGFTKIQKIDDNTNVALYLMAYLSDIELPVEDINKFYNSEIKTIKYEGHEKAFIKGRRLQLYPKGMNIVRHSKGIKYPQKRYMRMREVDKVVDNKTMTYHSVYRLSNDSGFATIIDKKEYRSIKNDK